MAIVDVTIYYLEMLAHAKRSVPAARGGLMEKSLQFCFTSG
jgi:hypothetical protein